MKLLPNKRRIKRIAIGLGIVIALLLILNGFMAWRTNSRWQNRIAEIRGSGEPASIADLAPHPVPDEHNAAVVLTQIAPRLKEFSRDHAHFSETATGKAYDEARERGALPTEEQTTAIEAIFNEYADVDVALAAAASKEHYASLMNYQLDHSQFLEEMLEHTNESRTPARFLHWRIDTLVVRGKLDDAVMRGIELLRLTRLFDQEPAIVNHLVAIACRAYAIQGIDHALRAGRVSGDVHRALDEELARHDSSQPLVHALKTERAFNISSADQACAGGVCVQPSQQASLLAKVVGWPIKRYYFGVPDLYDVQLDLATEPWYKVHQQIGRAGAPQMPTGFGVLADQLMPAIQAVHQASNRDRAMVRALRISAALAAYREQHGREANDLDELPLPKEATIDPFSGAPLQLKLTDDGWIIYTVFTNGVDDGGDFTDLKDYGLAPPGYRGK